MGFLNGFFYGLIQLVAKALNIVVAVCGTLSGIPVKSDGTFPGAGEEGNSILINLLTSESGGGSLAIVFGGLCIVTGLFSIFFAIIETMRTKAADGVSLYKPYAKLGLIIQEHKTKNSHGEKNDYIYNTL